MLKKRASRDGPIKYKKSKIFVSEISPRDRKKTHLQNGLKMVSVQPLPRLAPEAPLWSVVVGVTRVELVAVEERCPPPPPPPPLCCRRMVGSGRELDEWEEESDT